MRATERRKKEHVVKFKKNIQKLFFLKDTRSVQKVSDFFLSQTAFNQITRSIKAWAHTHTFMRYCEKFQADCASHSFSVKCLLRSHNTSLAILYFQENFIVMTEQIRQRYCIKFCQKLGDTQIETIQKSVCKWCGLKPNPDKRMV